MSDVLALPPRRPWLLPLAIGAAAALLHLATAATPGFDLFRDELYFLACGQHLSLGYVDQPPFIALVAKLAHGLFGEWKPGLRLLPALAGGGTATFAVLLARELGGKRGAELLAGAAAALAPVHLANMSLLTMNAFDVLAWAAAFYVLARVFLRGEQRLWIAFGLVAGVGLENKVSVLFLGAGVAVGLVATARGRAMLRTRWPYLGGAIALALAAPYFAWQASNGFPLRDLVAATARKNVRWTWGGYGFEQLIQIGFASAPLWLGGAVWLFAGPRRKDTTFFGAVVLTVLAILLSDPYSKPYFLAPLHVLPLAAGAVALEQWAERRRAPWLAPAWAVLVVLVGAVALPIVKPVLSPDAFVAYSRALGLRAGADERHEMGRLPQMFADRMGWRDLAGRVAAVHASLPPADREKACVFADNYGEAGAIEIYGEGRVPTVLSGHNGYWFWGPRGCTGEVMIILAGDREKLDQVFESVTDAGPWECPDCMPYERHKRLWVVRGLKQPLSELWPSLKDII